MQLEINLSSINNPYFTNLIIKYPIEYEVKKHLLNCIHDMEEADEQY